MRRNNHGAFSRGDRIIYKEDGSEGTVVGVHLTNGVIDLVVIDFDEGDKGMVSPSELKKIGRVRLPR